VHGADGHRLCGRPARRARSITGSAEPAFLAETRSWNWQQGQSETSASAPTASASATRPHGWPGIGIGWNGGISGGATSCGGWPQPTRSELAAQTVPLIVKS
jgi:hypothetical protein